MCTDDTFLELSDTYGDDESLLVVKGEASRVGGKGFLVAQAMRRLGPISVDLVAEVASDGSAFSMDHDRMLRRVLERDHRVWVVTSPDSVQRTFVRPGRRVRDSGFDSPGVHIEPSALLYLSAEDIDLVRAIVRAWTSAGSLSPLALNPCVAFLDRLTGHEELLRELLRAASYVLLNEHEHQRLMDEGHRYPSHGLIVVTEGARGGRYLRPDGTHWERFDGVICTVEGLTSAGSGDVFNGVLLGSRLLKVPLERALRRAARAASDHVAQLRAELA